MTNTDEFFDRANRLLDRWQTMLEGRAGPPDWSYDAYRWRHDQRGMRLLPVKHPHRVALDDLLCIERQKAEVVRNTRQFMRGQPANTYSHQHRTYRQDRSHRASLGRSRSPGPARISINNP